MKDKYKTKDQLINELAEMRRRITESEALETRRKRVEEAQDKELSCLRILAVDDDPTALAFYQEVLCPTRNLRGSESTTGDLDANLFGNRSPKASAPSFDIILCRQGDEAVETVRASIGENKPFAVVFLDVRLPPGPDGVWTAEHIRALDPYVQIVMITGYSDVDPLDITCRVPPVEKLFYIQKPLDPQEVRQFALALGAKWHAERQVRKIHAELEDRVKKRTAELRKANEELWIEITERKRTEEALRESEERFRTFLDNLGDVAYRTDFQGNVTYTNKMAEKITGMSLEDIIGKPFLPFFTEESQKIAIDVYQRTLNGESPEYELTFTSGRTCHFKNEPLRDKDRKIIGVFGIARDITERKRMEDALRKTHDQLEIQVEERTADLAKANEELRMEITERKRMQEALRESEEKYRTLTESSLTGIFIHQDGKYVFVNDRFAEIHDYRSQELLGKKYWTLIHPDEREAKKGIVSKRLKREPVPQRYEVRRFRKDRETIWCEMMATRIEYRGKPAIMGNIIDITDRKRAEEALQESEKKLRSLSSHLLTAQERERRRVSIELHDELGQALTLLKIRLRFIERKLRKDPTGVRQDCEDTLQYIDQVIENVRRLSRDLSPSILDDLGLSAAIRWLVDDFTKHYNIKTSLDMEDISNLFSPEAKITIYRIFQESLTNIGKHAQATRVSVAINKQDASVSFLVKDNGKGFDVEQVVGRNSTEKGLGLAAMDERARMLEGFLDIWSQEGKGTRITFTIPMNERGSR